MTSAYFFQVYDWILRRVRIGTLSVHLWNSSFYFIVLFNYKNPYFKLEEILASF